MALLKGHSRAMACVLTPIRVHSGSPQERGHATVAVTGKGRRAYWTVRALERAGFQVVDTGSEWRIDIRDAETGDWRVERGGITREYHSIYDLIVAIKGKSGIDTVSESGKTV